MEACECNVTLGNTGLPNCEPINKVTKKIIIVPYYNSSGSINAIDLTSTLNDAYFTARINDTDATKRWYPMPELKNITSEKADSTFQEFGDGSRIKIQDGVRTFTGLMPNKSPNFLSKIINYGCTKIGVFLVDKTGSLIGIKKVNGFLYPIKIDEPTWDARLVFAGDETVQSVQLNFDFHVDESDGDLRTIFSTSIDNVDLLALNGLIDVNVSISNISTTGFTAKYTTDMGDLLEPIVVEGLFAADFVSFNSAVTSKIYNQTDSLDVTVTVVETSTKGTYTVTYPLQTVADTLKLANKKNGFDFTKVNGTSILIP